MGNFHIEVRVWGLTPEELDILSDKIEIMGWDKYSGRNDVSREVWIKGDFSACTTGLILNLFESCRYHELNLTQLP